MTARMSPSRSLVRAGLLLAVLVPGCTKEPDPGERAAAAELSLTAEEMGRPSPSAAVVDALKAICAEPARRPVARAAAGRGFAPVTAAALREEMPGAAFPPDATAWRGPGEVGGAVLLWHADTATCEVRARGVNPVVVEAEFAKLPQTLEEAGASVMRLQAPPAQAGVPRTRQMLLVSSGGGPERARVLRLGDDEATAPDAVTLSARGVVGAGPAVVLG
jgi:hypothetical protein